MPTKHDNQFLAGVTLYSPTTLHCLKNNTPSASWVSQTLLQKPRLHYPQKANSSLSTPPIHFICKIRIEVLKSILITHRFHICKFTYLIKFTYNSKISTHGTFMIILGHTQWWKIWVINVHIPSWGWTRLCTASLFQFSCYKQVFFFGKSVPCFLHFCAFCWKLSY